jgi:hypothetical protein
MPARARIAAERGIVEPVNTKKLKGRGIDILAGGEATISVKVLLPRRAVRPKRPGKGGAPIDAGIISIQSSIVDVNVKAGGIDVEQRYAVEKHELVDLHEAMTKQRHRAAPPACPQAASGNDKGMAEIPVVLEFWVSRKERDDIRIEPAIGQPQSPTLSERCVAIGCPAIAQRAKGRGVRVPDELAAKIDMLPVTGIVLAKKFEHSGIRIFHVTHLAPGHALDSTPLQAVADTGAYQQRHQAYAED